MTLKIDAKFEEKLICCKNLVKFDPSTRKCPNLALSFVPDLCGKLHEKYGKFSPEHLKVAKLGL